MKFAQDSIVINLDNAAFRLLQETCRKDPMFAPSIYHRCFVAWWPFDLKLIDEGGKRYQQIVIRCRTCGTLAVGRRVVEFGQEPISLGVFFELAHNKANSPQAKKVLEQFVMRSQGQQLAKLIDNRGRV